MLESSTDSTEAGERRLSPSERGGGRRGTLTLRAVLWVAIAWLALPACSAVAQQQGPPPPPPSQAAQVYGTAAQQHAADVPWSALGIVLGTMALVWLWVVTGDWVNRDSQIFVLGYKKWGPVVFIPFGALFAILSLLPLPSIARLPILAFAFLIPIIVYVVVHNKSVQAHQSVLTGPWWRHFFAALLGKVGVKVSQERLADYEKGAAVELIAMGAKDPNQNNANLLTARQSPGYLLAKDMLAEMVKRRAEKTHLEYQPQGVAIRYEIDGMWHPGEARDRESADVLLAVMKTLANLDPKERRKKQSSQFGAKFEGTSYLCSLSCQGLPNGERVILTISNSKARLHTYESLGMRDAIRDQWAEVMARDKGMAVFSTLPGGGLTTLTNASLEETDRLMRDFMALEEVSHRQHDMQNIAVHTYDASKGETLAAMIPKISRLYPNVYVVRDLSDAEVGKLLLDEIEEDRLVVTSVRARDAAEAFLRLLALKLPQKQFAASICGVLYERLIRKLCPDCKVGYPPSADVLKKLGIPPGKVQQFYRPPKGEEIEKPCQTCQGIGYFGRTGIFEVIIANDQIREILATQPTMENLKKAARASQQRSLLEEGVLLVAKGVTSLPELQRVLKVE